MKLSDINIRDPFVLVENGTYYLYGTRAKDFGRHTGGFDVYLSKDLTCLKTLIAGYVIPIGDTSFKPVENVEIITFTLDHFLSVKHK